MVVIEYFCNIDHLNDEVEKTDNFLIQKRMVHYKMQLWKIISSGFDMERVFAIRLKYKKGYL